MIAAVDARAPEARKPEPSSSAVDASSGRLPFLDVARGLAVVAMLTANLINTFLPVRPHWLGHNLGDELLPLDFPAPVFQFLIGVSLVLFLAKRRRDGQGAARRLAARRFALLIVLGMVLDALAAWRFEMRWGVLQTLGLGGLIATLLADAASPVILACTLFLFAMHYGPGNNAVHRSALDCLAFVPLTLVGFLAARPLMELGRKPDAELRVTLQQRLVFVAFTCVTLAVALRAAGIPFNKVTGTSSFVAIATALSATIVALLVTLEARGVRFWPPLVTLGAHALTAWVLQYLLVYYPIEIFSGRPPVFPPSGGLFVVSLIVLVLAGVTVGFARRGIRIPL